MFVRFASWLALAIAVSPAPAGQTPDVGSNGAMLEAVRAADARLAGIAFRLTTANAPLCRDLQAAPGVVLHALDQYDPKLRPAASRTFGFEALVAAELVVAGSPAARAGVRANDAVIAVNGDSMPAAAAPEASSRTRDAAAAVLAAQPPREPLRFDLLSGGQRRTVTTSASPGCRATFELLLGPKLVARSDGRNVQIGARYLDKFADDQVAVLVAHELAHIILRHRERLEAAGVKWGMLSEFGRNARLFRRTEEDADLLGAHLMRNAGYDPQVAVRFWGEDVGSLDGGVFHSRTHPGSGARSRAVANELAAIPPGAPIPYFPPVLATRDQPLR